MNDEKEIPGVWLIFTVNARSFKPKSETNSSFLVLHPSSGVHTVKTIGSHLILWMANTLEMSNDGC